MHRDDSLFCSKWVLKFGRNQEELGLPQTPITSRLARSANAARPCRYFNDDDLYLRRNNNAHSLHRRRSTPMLGFSMRFNGWQRIGMVLSVAWVLVTLGAYSFELKNYPSGITSYFPRTAYEWVNDPEGTKAAHSTALAEGKDFPDRFVMMKPTFSTVGMLAISSIPVVLAWVATYLGLYTFLWVRRGFKT